SGPPVKLPFGESTGPVVLVLNTADETRASLGQIDVETGLFDLYITGSIETELFGAPASLPFESLITGRFDQESGEAAFQCESLVTVLEEADVPAVDCNHNGIEDEKEIEGGMVLDLNADGVPDSCQAARVMRFFHGEPLGGSIEARIGGYFQACSLSIPTYPGEACEEVMARFAAKVNEDECLAAQGVTAQTATGRLSLVGLGVSMEEEVLDPGIQGLHLGEPIVVRP
ncbi:MAG: hypothetical protein KDD47_05600, partial [Acidobacteria bacterium]|nr:hypothetical protein [Acidobacteriota bacterium]